MAEQVYDSHLGLQDGQRMLSRCQHPDDGPLHHTVAEPSYVELWLRTYERLDRLIRQGLEHATRATEGFESCPTKCIFDSSNIAGRTTRARACGAASAAPRFKPRGRGAEALRR
jgi:hypothetical protein